MSAPLKLRAMDADDMGVIGACLQDALVPVQDMSFIAAERRFVMVANRFCWEKLAGLPQEKALREDQGGPDADAPGTFERVHCGITFEHVKRVQTKGFTPGAAADQGRLLEVLMIQVEDEVEDKALTVVFSGGMAVHLDVDQVEAFVQDMGEPWPTMWRPSHPIEDELDNEGGTR